MQSDHAREYVIINRTLNNNRIGSASKRSIDLANKKAGEIKECNMSYCFTGGIGDWIVYWQLSHGA